MSKQQERDVELPVGARETAPEQIEPIDRYYLEAALEQKRMAEAALGVIVQAISKRYGLVPPDQIDAEGRILRGGSG